jgi:hypothetical protein
LTDPPRPTPSQLIAGIAILASAIAMPICDFARGRFASSNWHYQQNLFADWDRQFITTSHGKGILLISDHLAGPYIPLRAQLYNRAVYILYPRPVLLDKPADDASLARQGIGGVLTLKPGTLQIDVESSRMIPPHPSSQPADQN